MTPPDAPAVAGTPAPLASFPIAFESTQVRIDASVAGSPPLRLVLDTGMPTRGVLLYRSARVDALRLEFRKAVAVAGAGGSGERTPTRVSNGVSLGLGGLALAGVPVIELALPAGFPHDHDGVIGAELFERFVVHVDFDAERLDLFDPSHFVPRPEYTALPMRLRRGMPFVDARVALEGGDPIEAELALDLGAWHALWLNSRGDGRIAAPQRAIEGLLGRGLSGDVVGHIGRVRRIELGSFAFEDVVSVFPHAEHRDPGGVDFRDGFVGAALLSRFAVAFDYSRQRLLLAPGARFAQAFEHDMSGLVLDPGGSERQTVLGVLPASPAEEAGARSGDTLVALDGETLGSLGRDDLEQRLREPGRDVRITLERGSRTLELHLRLRRLV